MHGNAVFLGVCAILLQSGLKYITLIEVSLGNLILNLDDK